MKTNKTPAVFLAVIILVLFSCNRQKTNEPDLKRLNRWLNYYGLSLNHFTDTLKLKNNHSIKTGIDTSATHFKLYNDLYIYSHAKKYAVDLDSYSLVLEKNDEGKFVCYGTEADQEIALLKLMKLERQRILFCGTACRAEEAQWVDNQTVFLLGFSQPQNVWMPTIWVYSPKESSLLEIKANIQANKKPNSYNQAIRLNGIGFK